jgi:PAS domain S-box-containing protein
LDDLNEISEQLTQLSRQVIRYENGRDNLVALANIGQLINSSLDLHEVLRITMDTIIRLTRAERGFLMLRDDKGVLSIRIARNWEQESIPPSEFAISSTIVTRVISEGWPVLTTDAQEDPRFGGHESVVANNLRSILCVPLKVKEELTGLIYADNRIRSGIFTEVERDLLSTFANQAAVAIENARLFESVQRTLSEVTGLKSLMENIFASIASGVITTDIHDRITLCNRAAENILGCAREEMLGKQVSAIFPSIALKLSKVIDSVWESNQNVVGLEFNSTILKNSPAVLSFNLSPLKDADQVIQGVAIVLDDLTEKKRLEGQRRLFERMVSPAVIEQLNPDQLQLGGQRAEITTLFADIRGFTSFSEQQAPERLVAVLNRYLAVSAEAILAQEGMIDKFMGDAIMAWFNAPIPQPDHTLRAVRAAIGIQEAVCRLQNEMPAQSHLSFGIGIHFGEAVLGLVGTQKRLEYTAIGDSVNTAKRIQENALPGQILISAEAYTWVQNQIEARPVQALQVKGKSQTIQVYQVFGIKTVKTYEEYS